MTLVNRFYGVEHMIKKPMRLGEIPTTKKAYQDVIHIALPSVAEMVLMALIGSVDTMMVGVIGSEAIAAVGITSQPRMLMLAIFFALNIGVTAIVARRKGEGRQEDANRTMRNALGLIVILSIALGALGSTFSEWMMRLAGGNTDTPADALVLKDATVYFRLMAYALPINAITMCISAAQRGIGNTKITMYVNITSNLVNVVFNYLLINGNLGFPKLGVEGAAIATVIGFTVGLVLALLSIMMRRNRAGFLHVSLKDDWRFDKETIRSISGVGGNALLEQIALRIGFFLYAKMIYDALGPAAFSSHQICMQFLNISFTFGDGIGVAGTSLVGQMLGKGRSDLSMVYGKVSQRMALTVSAALLLVFIPFRYPLVELFVRPEEADVLQMAAQVMILVGIFQPFQTSSVVLSGCLRGAGDTRYVAAVMMTCVMIIRPVLSWAAIYPLQLGLVGAWTASLMDMIVRLVFVFTRFTRGKWMKIRI